MNRLQGYRINQDPLEQRRADISSSIFNDDTYTTDTDAGLISICLALQNLSCPIKLIPYTVLSTLGRFPCYDEEFDFVPLNETTLQRCMAVSHRWSDPTNTESNLDAEWILENVERVEWEEDELNHVAFFYDFSSLPQKHTRQEGLSSDERLTFGAGLEFLDYLFSKRATIIPSSGYLFRYWCYLEYFIIMYNQGHAMGNPFMDPLPFDLRSIDDAGVVIKEKLLRPNSIINLSAVANGVLQAFSVGTSNRRRLGRYVVLAGQLTRETILAEVLPLLRECREQIVGLLRSRFRQCSLTHSEDKAYLDTVLLRYFDKQLEFEPIVLPSLDVDKEALAQERRIYEAMPDSRSMYLRSSASDSLPAN